MFCALHTPLLLSVPRIRFASHEFPTTKLGGRKYQHQGICCSFVFCKISPFLKAVSLDNQNAWGLQVQWVLSLLFWQCKNCSVKRKRGPGGDDISDQGTLSFGWFICFQCHLVTGYWISLQRVPNLLSPFLLFSSRMSANRETAVSVKGNQFLCSTLIVFMGENVQNWCVQA